MLVLSQEHVVQGSLNADTAAKVLAMTGVNGLAIVRSQPAIGAENAARRLQELEQFGSSLGTPVMQSPRRELVEDVKDYSDIETTDDRGYRSGGELLPHSDPPTLIVLHCLQKAKEGGESCLVRVGDIVARMTATDPALVDQLFLPFPDWRVAGQYGIAEASPADEARPVLARHNGILSCVLYRPYIENAARALGTPLSVEQIAALDLFEQCSLASDLSIRLMLEPGDTLVLHNRSILHARTHFSDWPEMHRRRHLLRMWIDAPEALPVHPLHELGDFFAPRP